MGAQGCLDDEIREYQAAVCINPEAGSALPAPLLALAVGDVDGDGRNEKVTEKMEVDEQCKVCSQR